MTHLPRVLPPSVPSLILLLLVDSHKRDHGTLKREVFSSAAVHLTQAQTFWQFGTVPSISFLLHLIPAWVRVSSGIQSDPALPTILLHPCHNLALPSWHHCIILEHLLFHSTKFRVQSFEVIPKTALSVYSQLEVSKGNFP